VLALLFIGLPLIELYLLLEIGEQIGGWNTVALVFVTGIIGVTLAKAEGLRLLGEIREQLSQGQLPEESLLSGLLLVVGGAFLLTPGVLTDAFGLLMLIAPVRRAFAGLLRKRFAGQIESRVGQASEGGPAGFAAGMPFSNMPGGFGVNPGDPTGRGPADGEVIDVEAVVVEATIVSEASREVSTRV
jgi:UPF0716 protein FxsA